MSIESLHAVEVSVLVASSESVNRICDDTTGVTMSWCFKGRCNRPRVTFDVIKVDTRINLAELSWIAASDYEDELVFEVYQAGLASWSLRSSTLLDCKRIITNLKQSCR